MRSDVAQTAARITEEDNEMLVCMLSQVLDLPEGEGVAAGARRGV